MPARRSNMSPGTRKFLGVVVAAMLQGSAWAQENTPPGGEQAETSRISAQDLGVDHGQPGEMVIDRVVAVVGDRVLTSSDLRLEAVLGERDPSPIPLMRTVPGDSLQAIIDLALIRQKAGNITLYQPSAAEVRARTYLLRNTWSQDPREFDLFLEVWNLEEEDLESLIYSRLVAENFVHRQVVLASQSQQESEDVLEERYRAWIEVLREENPTRIVPPLEPLE
jgi:hypothetical protein